LTPGEDYWLQFRYNARAFGGTAIDLSVRFAGLELEKFQGILAVGVTPNDAPYNFMNLRFTPAGSTGLLEFVTTTEPAVDATLLLDAVSIVERDEDEVVIENPSFEASGSPTGVGYAVPIAGWSTTCGSGINIGILPFGPFSDNGVAPDQDRVLFLQQNCRLTQLIAGLNPGEEYTLTYAVNRRFCCDAPTVPPTPPTLYQSVSFGGIDLVVDEEILPAGAAIGDAPPYETKSLTFEAPAAEGELAFTTSVIGDASFLIDDVHIRPAGALEVCDNDVDDDGDSKTDCADEDCASATNCQGKEFYRGDPNNDGASNITDGIYILNFLFLGGAAPTCRESADPNNDRSVNITDGIYVLNYLFLGGPAPLPPGPPGKGAPCGPDTDAAGSAGDLGCDVYTKC
jgi:hypothetical protein